MTSQFVLLFRGMLDVQNDVESYLHLFNTVRASVPRRTHAHRIPGVLCCTVRTLPPPPREQEQEHGVQR